MTSIFEGQPPKTRSFPIKKRGPIWVTDIYIKITKVNWSLFFDVFVGRCKSCKNTHDHLNSKGVLIVYIRDDEPKIGQDNIP